MCKQEWILRAHSMEALSLRRSPTASNLRVKSQDYKTLAERTTGSCHCGKVPLFLVQLSHGLR